MVSTALVIILILDINIMTNAVDTIIGVRKTTICI